MYTRQSAANTRYYHPISPLLLLCNFLNDDGGDGGRSNGEMFISFLGNRSLTASTNMIDC